MIDGCSWRLASADSLWSLGLTRGLQPTKGVAGCSATRMSVTARRRFSGHLPVAVFSSANKLIHIVILRNDLQCTRMRKNPGDHVEYSFCERPSPCLRVTWHPVDVAEFARSRSRSGLRTNLELGVPFPSSH